MQYYGVQEKFPRDLELVRCLEFFEVPLLNELTVKNESAKYLEKFCDFEDGISRYLIVRTEIRSIAEYLAKKVKFKDFLIANSDGGCHLIDKNAEGIIVNSSAARFSQLPEHYLPEDNVYHDRALRPYEERTTQSFLIDADWNMKMIAGIERHYLTVASMIYFTAKENNRRLPKRVLAYEYDRGYPVAHLNRTMRESTPSTYKAKSVGVSAASPGVLTLSCSSEIVAMLQKTIEGIDGGKEYYRVVHKWSKIKPEESEAILKLDEALEDLKALCDFLSIDVESLFPEPTDECLYPTKDKKKLLTAAKIVTAFYRSLEKLIKPNEDFSFIG